MGTLGDTSKTGDMGGFGSMMQGLNTKKGFTPSKLDGTSSGPAVDKHRLEDYDDAMRRIKDATGVSDVNEII